MLKEYLTVGKQGQFELIERKSRFIATVEHTKTNDEALAFIDSIKRKYYDAGHNVYSYSTDSPAFIQKYSDDGEPSGTAGLPVMEAIKKNGLSNVCIVVTRYFGGILLGASGLVRAYGKCAFKGIEEAGIVKMTPHIPVKFILEYGYYGKVENYINVNQLIKGEINFGTDVELVLNLPEDQTDSVIAQINDLTGGGVLIAKGEAQYRAVAL